MKKQMIAGAVALAFCHPVTGLGANKEELTELMRQVQQMREEYEQRISTLEARLEAAEAAAKHAESTAKKAQSVAEKVEVKEKKSALDEAVAELEAEEAQPAVATTQPSRDLWSRRIGSAEVRLLDIALNNLGVAGGSTANNSEIRLLHGGEHDPRRRGYTFQQSELYIAGAVDPYFRADSYVIASEEGVELEEAYFTTTSLPKSLELKGGYFLTEFGLNNPTHPHSWAFIDQPVINTRLFGGGRPARRRVQAEWPVAASLVLRAVIRLAGPHQFNDGQLPGQWPRTWR